MVKTLIIVESGDKANKVKQVLGSNYDAVATYGHIIDLDKKSMSIDIDNNFQPQYKVINDKIHNKNDIIKKIKQKYNQCDDILLATDPDREGEMIAWSIAKELNLKNPKRVKFFSMNKPDILKGITKIYDIDEKLVDAQKMRRLLDRLVGFKVSPILWKNLNDPTLSAGRTQSVALKLIVEKERDIENFLSKNKEKWFKINATFETYNGEKLKSILYKIGEDNNFNENDNSNDDDENKNKIISKKGSMAIINTEEGADKLMKLFKKSIFKIDDVLKKESIRKSQPPFETSSLQRDAYNKLGFSSLRTMNAAQHLYNSGYITYMRTDSISLSDEALKTTEQYILDNYTKSYYNKTEYKTKDKNAQEAHECIRPSDITINKIALNDNKKIGNDEIKLYDLIWKRTIASQMKPAIFYINTIYINIDKTDKYFFITKTESIKFDGFLKIYNMKNLEDIPNQFTDVINNIPKINTKLKTVDILCQEEFKNPPKRYNENTLLGMLKKLGIGRPATYQAFAKKLLDKKYISVGNIEGIETTCVCFEWDGKNDIVKKNIKNYIGKDTNKFIPSKIATVVIKFLEKKFKDIMDYGFTAEMEKKLDKISEGKLKWNDVLSDFYVPFNEIVTKVLLETKDKTIIDENSRFLGKHPDNNNKIYTSIAKHGAIVKMIVKDGKDIIAPLREPYDINTVTLADVIPFFRWPKNLGKWERKNVILTNGKNGYWLKAGLQSITLGKNDVITLKNGQNINIDDFNLKHAIKLFEEKKELILWSGKDSEYNYIVENGDFGLFVRVTNLKTKKKFNVSIENENIDVKKLTVEIVRKIIDNHKPYKKKFTRKFVKKN